MISFLAGWVLSMLTLTKSMKPVIRFLIRRKIFHLRIRIGEAKNKTPYNLGVSADVALWHQGKQICGDPTKQFFLDETKKKLEKLYLTGMSPDDLWALYQSTVKDVATHTINNALKYYVKNIKVSKRTKEPYNELVKKGDALGFGDTSLITLNASILRGILEVIKANGDRKELMDSSVYLYYTKLSSAITFYNKEHGIKCQGDINSIISAPHLQNGKVQVNEDQVYLELHQLRELMEINLDEDDQLAEARSLFIRQCFTGMAIVDLERMQNPEDYKLSIDGVDWFRYSRVKSKRVCEIPMTDVLRMNLEEFEPIPFTRRTYHNLLTSLGKMIGVKLSSHVGRHTFGVIMLNAGYSIETVSKMMGHSSIKITESIYAKITRNRVREEHTKALPKLNSIIL